MTGDTFTGVEAADMGLVNSSVPLAELRDATIALAARLMDKNPVVLRAAKHGFKRARELTWEQCEDYLYAKLDKAQLRDPEHGREQGLKQFLDDKTIAGPAGPTSADTSADAAAGFPPAYSQETGMAGDNMTDRRMLIAGEWCAARDGRTFDRFNPRRARWRHGRRRPARPTPTRRSTPRTARSAWSALAPTERRRLLLKAADLMDARIDAFIATGVAETGATPGWIGFNVTLAANMLREAASMTTQIAGDVIPSDVPGNLALAMRVPCGVVLGIAPWNAPVILGTRAGDAARVRQHGR